MFLDRWDRKEKDKERKQARQETIGRFMVVGSGFFLAVYIFTLFLE